MLSVSMVRSLICVYKRIPEEWLKKQSPQKQYDVLKFLQRLKFWKHDNKPYMDGGFSGPTRHDKAKQYFIVGLEAHPLGKVIDAESVANSHYELLAPYVGSNEKAKKTIV
ncbi:hypothetical protein QL285_040169 [Trifolium repens]|nr:hypothetical protein QL285_040169 [Trifolium repens]